MKLLSLLIPLCLALSANSLFIIFPLYLYPGENGAAWSDVFSTIEAYPSVQYQMVINPNTGPGTSSLPTDANIIAGISKLNTYPNVHTVGYVETYHGTRSTDLVNADTAAYASWANYPNSNIAIGGIYYDDVGIVDVTGPSNNNGNGSIFAYYANVTDYARTTFKSPIKIVFNPGTRAPAQLFNYADTVVEFEDSFVNFQAKGIVDQIPAGLRAKSAVQIYDTPEGSDVGGVVGQLTAGGVGGVYLGVDRDYKVYSKVLMGAMAGAVGGGQSMTTNGSGNHSSTG